MHTEVVKLYILDQSKSFLYKVSQDGISKQYEATKCQADPNRLSDFLETYIDFRTIELDTVEDDVYYLYIEEAPHADYTGFLQAVSAKFGVDLLRLLAAVNKINQRQVTTLNDCFKNRAVSGVKVPFATGECKLYARPFKTGNGYALDAKAEQFFCHLYDCDPHALSKYLEYLWVSTELLTERLVLTTQYHALLHA